MTSRRLRVGSNQYKERRRVTHRLVMFWCTFFLTMTLVSGLYSYEGLQHLIREVNAEERFISARPDSGKIEVTPTPTPTIDPNQPSEEEKIVRYIKTIFGKEWKTACAVARAESGLRTKAALKWEKENSRGIFQINIQSDYAKVHYDRIPGKNLEEKITWLEDPYNNTLLAYWIYSKSGWNPWTAYTKETYIVKLSDCK